MNDAARVLIVEDDPDIRFILVRTLEEVGHRVFSASSGAEAVEQARLIDPDLITLDLTLPDADGTEVCRRLRDFTNAYIMMVTGRSEQADRLVGLEVGADDYLLKPFSPQELRARVAALLRRPRVSQESQPAPLVDAGGGLVLLASAHTALLHGVPLPLTPTEVDLLAAFASAPGRTWTRSELVKAVWQGEFVESDFLVDVSVGSVRRKLRQAGSTHQWISTVDGTSYAFAPVDTSGPSTPLA